MAHTCGTLTILIHNGLFQANLYKHTNQGSYMSENSLKKIRESLLMSRTELARKANISPITIARIENGKPCRMETKRKIILALGFGLSEKDKIFSNND
jgi:DNA-binding XRE family transcriptional regulator